ncbi:hypothetical protein VMCG_05724 [Cytospora schulzeri]|uniref:Uncharacterized protein n=1 Tax=Cytospora schulzeri TaxID=448051 RepID=A0A423WIM1_9PEZI|nr:hypothetical protein VMCG_05724 [Valsa malicola]
MKKRVTIQTDRGILYPGGPPSTRRGMWRSRQQTYIIVAAVIILYGLFSTARNLIHGGEFMPSASEPPRSSYDREIITVAEGHDCPEYDRYATKPHEPRTGGIYNLPYMRPAPECRKVVIPEVEEVIREMNKTITDPDLFRLFENCFPNTLDTSVTWTGVSSKNVQEELTFITTGDIHAMWLRDSANQLQSYVSLLRPIKEKGTDAKTAEDQEGSTSHSSSKLASLFRGAINLQGRYILASPHCNAFQPPAESGIKPDNDGNRADFVAPPYDPEVVFECKYELDSLASFLQLSWDYFSRTKDSGFFIDASRSKPPVADFRSGEVVKRNKRKGRRKATDGWLDAVIAILDTADVMRRSTYESNGKVPDSPYQFRRITNVATETLPNGGNGSPVKSGTGLVRSAFRPSDDATTFQFLVPANMMLAKYLGLCAEIVEITEKEEERLATISGSQAQIVVEEDVEEETDDESEDVKSDESVSKRMRRMAKEIKDGIERYGKIYHPDFGKIYAYEVDGYWSANSMDDANLPSLLSAPLTGYTSRTDPTYRATRKFVLSDDNPYYDHGPVINGTGGAHIGPGMAWPMSLIVGIMTSDDDDEIKDMLSQLISSTNGLGLIHESINVWDAGVWTRPWFSWANGLFGQMILDLRARKPGILKTNFQR